MYNLIFNEMIRTNSNYRSQEKYAEALNAAHKHVSVLLPHEQLEIIQDVLDAHCEELYEDYLSDYSKLEARFIEQAMSSMGISSRYLPYGTAPHERAFLDETSEKSRNLRAALRQLSAIYETLGLRTNYPLRRVLGYKSQGRRFALQGE